jgi:rfaE bifunctional protein kinase chain/domain
LSPDRCSELLSELRNVRVLVVGDLMLDAYLRGPVTRISPEAPVPVVNVVEEWRSLGGAANVAMNVVALGAGCDVIGCVGRDRSGDELLEELGRVGIASEGVWRDDDRPTTVKTRLLTRHQQVARFDIEAEHDVDESCAAALVARIEALVPLADVIVLEDYDKGVLVRSVIGAAMDAGRRYGRPVIVDPKAKHFFDYAGATVFKPNLSELSAALRAPVLPGDAEWMERTRRHLDCSHLLLTLGEDGMALITEAGEYVRVPATARAVYDVSGAGDTVTAVVAGALGAGASIAEAAVLANIAAGLEVGKAGVATVSPDELMEAVASAPLAAFA